MDGNPGVGPIIETLESSSCSSGSPRKPVVIPKEEPSKQTASMTPLGMPEPLDFITQKVVNITEDTQGGVAFSNIEKFIQNQQKIEALQQ